MNEYDHLFKILLIGNAGVGKSSLLLRFTDDTFCSSYLSTIGVDFKVRTIERAIPGKENCRNQIFKLQIWDTAGQERFRTITSTYYRGIQGAIIAYDVTNRESFHAIDTWLQELDKYNSVNDLVIMLVGNKCDRVEQRVVSMEEGRSKAEDHGMLFAETSALASINVNEAFLGLADGICSKRQINGTILDSNNNGADYISARLRQRVRRSQSSCCN